jgi:hypothetical protein
MCASRIRSAAGFALVTLVMASPFVDYRHLTDASYEGDSRLLIWTLAWDSHAMLTASSLFDANMFHPASQALAWAEHHVGIALFAMPAYALTGNPVLAYWLIWLIAFPLNALAMQALAYRVTGDRIAAFGAGLVYAFCFFRMHHAHGHLQMLWTWPLPLVPLALERWVERPSVFHGAVAAALVLLQALSGWYLAVYVALLSLVAALFLLSTRRLTRAHLISGALALTVSVATLAWFAAPYTRVHAGGTVEAAGNSADLAAYLVPPQNTWLGQLIASHTTVSPRWIWGEQTLYIGLTTLVMAAMGLWKWRNRPGPLSAAILTTGAIALGLSLGPVGGWSPYDLVTRLPALSLLRAPARFALLVMLAAALLVSLAIADLRSRLGRASPAVLIVLALVGLSESYVIGFPGGKPPQMATPAVYQRLNTLPAGAVLSLPSYVGTPEAFRESDYLLFSTAHWRPIVNGFGRQDPPGHGDTMETVSRFPAADAIQRLCNLQARYVVLHTGRASELRRAAQEAQVIPGIRSLGRFGDDFLFDTCPRAD